MNATLTWLRILGSSLAPALCVLFFLLGLCGPWLSSLDPEALDLNHIYALPSANHPLGTADNGVDILAVLLHGTRLAAQIGVSVVGCSVLVGATLGAIAGLWGGAVDQTVCAVADVVQAFPAVLLNIAILALVESPGIIHVVIALSANGWVLFARLARAETLVLREREFVAAAQVLGASRWHLLRQHIVPNLLGPIVVQASAAFGGVVLMEATLSFLGLGPGRASSWGALLDQGSSVLLRFPHVALFSGSVIALTVLAFNLSGDGLRDWLDPTQRRSRAA